MVKNQKWLNTVIFGFRYDFRLLYIIINVCLVNIIDKEAMLAQPCLANRVLNFLL